jgi:8-oxo-dGTP diphosphatase
MTSIKPSKTASPFEKIPCVTNKQILFAPCSFDTLASSINVLPPSQMSSAMRVFMVKRANEPFLGLPGRFVDVDIDDTTDTTALRKSHEKTGVAPQYLEQLQIFSSLNRDPRGFSITLVFYVLIAEQQVLSHLATIDDVQWIDIKSLHSLSVAFDHKTIIEHAITRLQKKSLYTIIPVYNLPESFTIGQLKSVIEVIIGKPIQRKSLIRRIEASGMFETVDQKVQSGGRLAQLYKVKSGVDIVNFGRNLST